MRHLLVLSFSVSYVLTGAVSDSHYFWEGWGEWCGGWEVRRGIGGGRATHNFRPPLYYNHKTTTPKREGEYREGYLYKASYNGPQRQQNYYSISHHLQVSSVNFNPFATRSYHSRETRATHAYKHVVGARQRLNLVSGRYFFVCSRCFISFRLIGLYVTLGMCLESA